MKIKEAEFTNAFVWEVTATAPEIRIMREKMDCGMRTKCGSRAMIATFNNRPAFDSHTILPIINNSVDPFIAVINKGREDKEYRSELYRESLADLFTNLKAEKVSHPENIPIDQVLFDFGAFSYILAPLEDETKLEFRILKQNPNLEIVGTFPWQITNRGYPYLDEKEFSLRGEDSSKDYDGVIIEFKASNKAEEFRKRFNSSIADCLRAKRAWKQVNDCWILE